MLSCITLTRSDFVRECYHPDYKVGAMGVGWYEGIDKFIGVEKAVWSAAPSRRMRILHMRPTETAVIVEAAIVDPTRGVDWELPFCVVLEIRGDKIEIDRIYADFKAWPRLDSVL